MTNKLSSPTKQLSSQHNNPMNQSHIHAQDKKPLLSSQMQKQQEPKHVVPSTKHASWCATDWNCSFHWISQSWLCLTWFLECSWSQRSSERTRNKTPTAWSLYSDENLEFPWSQLELLILVCYGSDEEQARTAAENAADQKCHTHRIVQQRWKRRIERKNTHRLTWFTLIKATSTGGKTESFSYYGCNIQMEAYLWKIQGILALYRQRTKQKKKITE